MKYVVVWGTKEKKGVPADEKYYGSSEAEAKELARELLTKAKQTDLIPVSVLKVTEKEAEDLIVSEREMEELMPDEDFIILKA